MDFEAEIELITSMYPDNLIVKDSMIVFNVTPNTEYGVHNMVECNLEVTSEKSEVSIRDPKGLDEEEVVTLITEVTEKFKELMAEEETGILFSLIDF
jgi:hypothetical protein